MASGQCRRDEDAFESLRAETTTCVLCLQDYTKPKLLNCQHSFCEHCLEQWVARNNGRLNCPSCRQAIALPQEGVKGLPMNRIINNLMDFIDRVKTKTNIPAELGRQCETCPRKNADKRCVECAQYICTNCSNVHIKGNVTKAHRILTINEFEEESRANPTMNHPSIYCEKHTDKTVDVYCKTCKMCVCVKCAFIEHPNPEHQYTSIEDAAQEAKERFKGLLQQITDKRRQMSDAQSAVGIELRELAKHCNVGLNIIDKHANEIIKNVQTMQQKAKENFQQAFSEKEATLKKQMEKLTLHENSLIKSQQFAETEMESICLVRFLMSEGKVRESIQNLLSTTLNTKPDETRYLYFNITGHSNVGKFGEVQTGFQRTSDSLVSVADDDEERHTVIGVKRRRSTFTMSEQEKLHYLGSIIPRPLSVTPGSTSDHSYRIQKNAAQCHDVPCLVEERSQKWKKPPEARGHGDSLSLTMDIRGIRIGTFKVELIVSPVEFTRNCITFKIAVGIQAIHLRLMARDIIRVEIFDGQPASLISLFTTTRLGLELREKLKMNTTTGWFDPDSVVDAEKRIIFIPKEEPLDTHTAYVLNRIFTHVGEKYERGNIIEKLTCTKANNILIETSSVWRQKPI